MRLFVLLLALLPAPALAEVFCYYLIDRQGTVQTFAQPPFNVAYPPPEYAPGNPDGNHLIIALVRRCQADVRPRQDVARPLVSRR